MPSARKKDSGHSKMCRRAMAISCCPSLRRWREYCHARPSRLKDDKQREFVSDMYVRLRSGEKTYQLGRLGYLVSIYIQIGGRI